MMFAETVCDIVMCALDFFALYLNDSVKIWKHLMSMIFIFHQNVCKHLTLSGPTVLQEMIRASKKIFKHLLL